MSLKQEMFKIGTDQKHLKQESYKTAEKLNVRILTHQKYTQPKVEFYDWVLNQIEWAGDEVVFDIGCGSGKYAEKVSNLAGRYVACDLSHGMLKDGAGASHDCLNLNAMTIPLQDNSVDVILANHMIYHLPDQVQGVAEFRRVLKPGGKLIAATNSSQTMLEMRDLRITAVKSMGLDPTTEFAGFSAPFDIESGADVLRTGFDTVESRILQNWLIFPEAQPVIDYIESSRDWYEKLFPDGFTWDDYEAALRRLLNEHFAFHQEFRVSKKTGAFVCF
ncbi:MAG: ubiquinone/menaquinone biosynthesis C-methylase UbiE [Cellvibrionaceae bacterium]|jgi:ubiquinone/menaquinone biosynthesis C-methylase UbiE